MQTIVKRWSKIYIYEKNKAYLTKLKKAFIENCLLAHFDPVKEVELMIDASDLAVGGVLLQNNKLGWRPIEYFAQMVNFLTQKALQAIRNVWIGLQKRSCICLLDAFAHAKTRS